jgi:IclR family acetate operon transcriptional repressor
MNRKIMPTYSIPNLGNACRLLRHMSDQRDGLSVTQLAQALKLPRTTCLRIVHTLASEGFLREQGGTYVLGGAVIPLGLKALQDLDLYTQSSPILRRLTEVTGETSHLAVWSDSRSLIINVCDSPHPLRAASRPGTRAYGNCSATGKILLAFNHLENIGEILPPEHRARSTAHSICDLDELKVELRRVQALGYALDNEEYHEGVRCLAAPVRNAHGEVCASIGLTAATVRFPESKTAEVAREVIDAGNRLSLQLGWNI